MARSPNPRIRYRWHGPLEEAPMIGHLLASKKGRGAYRILGITDSGPRTDADGEHRMLKLVVERVARAAIEEPGAVVHGIVWDRRERRRAA